MTGAEGIIAFHSDRDGDYEIFTTSANGTNVRQLTHNTHFDGESAGRRTAPKSLLSVIGMVIKRCL